MLLSKIMEADAILIATQEHNDSVPGVLLFNAWKNYE
jgi:NAD(P)H-dependent FMN reductase